MPVKPKGGLGRGLDALIPGPEHTGSTVHDVPIDAIGPNPRQPRQAMSPETLQELADSIKEHGLIQPLIVSLLGEGVLGSEPRYELIAGERRLRAARLAGLDRVPVIIKEATAQESLELALVENVQRADLNPLEEATAYRQLVEEFGLTQDRVADRVGKSRTTVTNTLRLLGLPDEVKTALLQGVISEGHARALLALDNALLQLALLKQIGEHGLSVRATEELVRRLNEEARLAGEAAPEQPEKPKKDAQTAALEDDFRRSLGTKVELFRTSRGGRLVIHFYSDEELDGIYNTIMHRS